MIGRHRIPRPARGEVIATCDEGRRSPCTWTEAGARYFNALLDGARRALALRVDLGFGGSTRAGKQLASAMDRPIVARLSGPSSPYSWAEADPTPGGGYAVRDGGRSGTADAYEVNDAGGLGDKVVRLRRSATTGDWRFQYLRKGGEGDPCEGRICIRVFGVACEGEGDDPPLDGVLVNVFTADGSEFVGSCTTGPGDDPEDGRCCIDVPPGTYLIRIPSPGPEDVGCEVEIEDITVLCDEVEVDDQQTCCGQINITVIDADTDGVIEGATVPGYTGNGPGTWELQWTGHCDGETEQIIIGAEGYYSACLEVVYNCHAQPSYTVKLYSEENWVQTSSHAPCSCAHLCDGGATRPPSIFPKLLYGTPSGPAALFGPWSGTSIPLTYVGDSTLYHSWQSECLDTGGEWRCMKDQGVNCCPEGGPQVPHSRLVPITAEDAEGSGEDQIQNTAHARLTLHLPSGDTLGDCAVLTWENLMAEDCTGETPAMCNTTLGLAFAWPLYCLFTASDYGVECGPGNGTNDCQYYVSSYPSPLSGNVGFSFANHSPVCGPAMHNLQIYAAEEGGVVGPECQAEPGSHGFVFISEM
jgi:hypothetical protein